MLVSESGASIDSASEAARREFPDLDLTVRGIGSIGRRLIDPLSELVRSIQNLSVSVSTSMMSTSTTSTNPRRRRDELCQRGRSGGQPRQRHLLTYVSGLGPQLAANMWRFATKTTIHLAGGIERRPAAGQLRAVGRVSSDSPSREPTRPQRRSPGELCRGRRYGSGSRLQCRRTDAGCGAPKKSTSRDTLTTRSDRPPCGTSWPNSTNRAATPAKISKPSPSPVMSARSRMRPGTTGAWSPT